MNRLFPIAAAVFLCLLIGVSTTCAQGRLSIYDLDVSSFPTIRAKILAVDDTGNPLSGLQARDLSVTENTMACRVTRLACGVGEVPRPLSVAVSFDLSTSMYGHPTSAGQMPFTLAQDATRFLARSLPMPHSELALQGFDSEPRGGVPFTRIRDEILMEVDHLPLGGDNEFGPQMDHPDKGLLNIVKKGVHSRVAILITDDNACDEPFDDQLIRSYIDTCAKYSIRVYALVYRIHATEAFAFQSLVDATGGRVFDRIADREDSEAAIREILDLEQGGIACEIEWEAQRGCPDLREVAIRIPVHALSARTSYTVPADRLPQLYLEPSGLGFGALGPGATGRMEFTIGAENYPVTILSIDGIAPPFSLDPIPLPLTLQPGETRILTVRFTPTDSVLSFAHLRFSYEDCAPISMFLSGGVNRSVEALRVIGPNGGEKLLAGSITTLRWTGVSVADPVTLEYSIDQGANWNTIAQYVTGLEYDWLVPPTPSDRCLLRISRSGEASPGATFTDRSFFQEWCAFSPDGSLVAVANGDNSVSLRNAATGAEVRRLIGHIKPMICVEFSPDGRHVVTGSYDNTARVWEVATGTGVHLLTGHVGQVRTASFSPDGTRIITAGDDRTIVWSAETGARLKQSYEVSRIAGARFSHDGSQVIVATNNTMIRNAYSGLLLRQVPAISTARHAESSADGRLLLFLDISAVRVIETGTWRVLTTIFPSSGSRFTMAHFRSGSNTVVTTSNSFTEFRDPYTGQLLARLPGHGDETTNAAFSSDGRRLVTVGRGGGTIWDLAGASLAADVSDSLWSIVIKEDLAAGFLMSDDQICEWECVQIDNASSGNATSWEWTFTGGSPSNATGPYPGRVCYSRAGQYQVRLVVGNGTERDTLIRMITVAAPPPVPVISRCGATLRSTPAAGYRWFLDGAELDGLTGEQITISVPGRYSVRTTSVQGCSSVSEPIDVTTLAEPGLLISIPELSAAPGEIVRVPITFRFSNPGDRAPYNMKVVLVFNATMLIPVDREEIAQSRGNRRIEIPLEGSTYRDTTITVALRTALGESTWSTLHVESVQSEGPCSFSIDSDAGRVQMTDLCTNGGLRLVTTSTASLLKSIRPNPARGVISIEYSLVENGSISIALFDLLGNRVATVASGIQSPGEYSTTYDVSALPPGEYFCVYITPTERFTKLLRVE